MSDQFEGSCLCGAVRFVATGAIAKVAEGIAVRRSDNQVQFVARQVAGILRQVRVDDLRG
jgi:hypothetical protein